MRKMLEVRNLHARVEGKEILRGIDLRVAAGEVHAIMGPNGSGKSTLAQVLAGRDTYEVTAGEVLYKGKDLLGMAPELRAVEGSLPRLPVPRGDSRPEQPLFPAGRDQRGARPPR